MTLAPIVLGDLQTEFFAPVASDLIDGLLGQYRSARATIAHTAGLFAGDMGGIVHYFMRGNGCDQRGYSSVSAERLFQEKGAVAALNAAFWSKALALTDVLDVMPQKRRDAWNEQITKLTTLEFAENIVRPTLETLLASRQQFLAERVDGIFRALSGEHVTNSPMGFGKRMIIGYMLSYGSVSYERAGYIGDLRCVIAKFMGRDEPKYQASGRLLESLKLHWGQWVTLDGGALRIRLYRKGTAHLEVHPDMAWRLNQILAHLHPLAIPAEHRTKPARRPKTVPLILRPLPFAVLDVLADSLPRANDKFVGLSLARRDQNRAAWEEACRVLVGLGGALQSLGGYAFDYPPRMVLDDVITSGCLPDQVSHQYYATPESVAREAIELAAIGPNDTCLEPSAGQGGLADFMPWDRTTCVEISPLHCLVLRAKGYCVVEADFLAWRGGLFDRIVMNPPYSENRWRQHVEHAATMLRAGGRLVAVLPASAKGKDVLPRLTLTWSRTYSNEFAGTSVSVVILTGERA